MKNKKFIKLNKGLSIAVIVCMLFQISPFSFFFANKVFAGTGFRHQVQAGTEVVLGGNYIEVGISKSGSFGTANAATAGFHPTNGGVGLRVDGDGFDIGNPPTTGDFFLPGQAEESFTIGYKVGSAGVAPTKYSNSERMGEVNITTVTTDTTSSDDLSALTTGTTSDNNLTMQQKISFKVNDKFFKNTVTYTNKGTSNLYDVRYMRSFDPDQDAVLHNNYNTNNQVIENFAGTEKRAIVKAAGGTTGDTVFFISMDNRARASNPGLGLINRDPYDLKLYNTDGAALKLGLKSEDSAIAITFSLGTLAPGQSTTLEYYTSLDPDYNSGLANIMGSLGLQINNGATTTNSLGVTLNLSGQNVAQMQFSNDNSTWSEWETYASTKAWTLTAGDGNKTVYAQLKDSSGSISNLNASIVYASPDITPPTLSVSGNPTTWTNSNVTLTVNASDASSGLNAGGAYSFDGGSNWTTSNTKSFLSNGPVNIKVRDNLGNISSQDIVIDKIDKTAPTFSSITQTPTLPAWSSGAVTLTVNDATDNVGSGLNSTAYSFSTTQGVYNWQVANVSSAFSQNKTVYVYVRDALGNISNASTVNITNIDITLPNTPVINNSGNFTPTKWYNSAQTVTGSFIATAGCSETLQYSLNNGAWTNGSSVIVTQAGVNTLKFRVIDELGRTSGETSCVVQIDTTNPTVSANDTNYSWRNNDFNVTIDYSDAGGSSVNTKEYAVTNSSNTPSSWTSASASKLISISSEGQWYIHYKVTDLAGNSSVGSYGPYKLDKIAPSGTISIQPDNIKAGNNYVRNQVVSMDLTGNDNLSSVSQMRFANSASDLTNAAWETFGTVKSGFNLSNDNGLKTVYFQLKDNAGNLSSVYSNSIYFDNVKPTLTISAPSKYVAQSSDVITYTVTFNDNSKDFGNSVVVENQGIDSINFGIDKIVLSKFGSIDTDKIIKTIEDVANEPLKKLIKLSIPSDINAEGSINLKISASAATDKAGNLSDETACSYAFSMDNVPSVNQNEIFKGDLRVKGGSDITLNGTSVNTGGLGSDSVRFAPVNYNGTPVNTTTITSTPGSSLHINAPLNEGEYYLYVVDSAGNISSGSTHKIIVDNSGPIVTISEPSKTITKGDSEVEYLITFPDDATIDSINSLFVESKIGFKTTGTANAKASIETVAGNDRQKKVKLFHFTGDGSIDSLVIAPDVARDSIENISIQTIKSNKVIVDNTMPTVPTINFTELNGGTINKILNFVTFKNFWNGVIEVKIQASDLGGSNLSKIYYKISESDSYTAVTPDAQGNITFELPVGFKGNVWIYSEDASGNKSATVKSDGTISENNAPEIIVTPEVLSTWYTEGVTINVKVTDNEGLKAIRYSVDGVETVIDMVASYTDKQVNKEFTIPVAGDSKGHNVQINTVDLAGNNSATYNAVVKIDSALPTIASVTGNPSDWTKDSVTLTVNASDAMSELAEKAYSFDNGSTWQVEKTKTYEDNTSNIVVKVKDAAGNIATYDTINITKIDKTEAAVAEVANASSYTDNKWFNEKQTITASFLTTPGCDERLQYKVDNATSWTDGASVDINVEGKYTVNFRVIDYLGRTSEVQTVKVNLDKTAPTSAKITVEDKEFTSFLNTITFGIFFNKTVDVEITADSNISGTNKIEYQKVSSESEYKQDGSWTEGSSLSVKPDEKFVVYARITDNANNSTIINSNGVIVDATTPALALTPAVNGWAKNNVNVKVAVSDELAGVKEVTYTTDEAVPQSGTVAITAGEGTITLANQGQYKLTVTAKDNSLNEISESADIKIDKTLPIITGASNDLSYYIGRVINVTDAFGEIADATYKNAADTETSFKDGYLFEKAGKYTLTLTDKAGNRDSLSFEIIALPKVEDVLYKADCKALIDSIRAEFDKHNDLTEPYKTDTDNKIKALENRYAQLDKEVTEIKTETSVIKGKVDKLPNGVDGLLNLQKQIQDEYNKIAGNTSTLTTQQKVALEKEAEYLKQQLIIIETLQNQINNMKTQVSNVDTKDEGLISRESEIRGLLSDIEKLTKEQQSILKPQIDLLNSLLLRGTTLKEQVKNLKEMINSLPAADKITKQDAENINKINQLYSKFTNEQKELLGADLIKLLNGSTDILNKLMLHDDTTDVTVTGVDGTSFTPDVYLVVTPIKVGGASAAKFSSASVSIKSATKNIAQLEGKELLSLYDVSLFKDNIKIQPNGKVKVKIKIPDNLISSAGLDIVHIADDGTVTPMNATVEGRYLAFTTTHFSDYAIVGKVITKEIPKTGSPIDSNSLISLGMLFLLAGLFLARKKRV